MDAQAGAGRRRVAVVGSGVSGLTAAWVLRHDAEVTLYEADDRPGGHAHTHDVRVGEHDLAVDSGFLVHNTRTYPQLVRLFDELGVLTQPTEMSMSVHCEGCGLEYAGARGPRGLVTRPRALTDLRYLRMLGEIPRFHRQARALLADPPGPEVTLADVLRAGRYSRTFVAHFVLPLVSAVWSCPPGLAPSYPATSLLSFLSHHGMLSISGSPPWRSVVGGSRTYVEKITRSLPAVRLSTPVRSLRRTADGVQIRDAHDHVEHFDAAVVATHADQALDLLESPTAEQQAILGAFTYSRNVTTLHHDERLMPLRGGAQASWNVRMHSCSATSDDVLVTYDVSRLQSLPGAQRCLVTLGGEHLIDPELVVDRMVYTHPVYTTAAVVAQAELGKLDDNVLAFAGAYQGWGFHEDGARSGVAAAAALGTQW